MAGELRRPLAARTILMSHSSASPDVPDTLGVVIEVPRGSFIKRQPDGRVDFVSPLPSPFNYGSVVRGQVEGLAAEDGDPLDVLVLGARVPRGRALEVRVWGWVDFVDAGEADPKLVATQGRPPSAIDWLRVRAFFVCYARLKGALQRARGRRAPTQLRSVTRVR